MTSKGRERFVQDSLGVHLDSAFDVTVCGEDVARAKPDPEGILLAISSLPATPERTVHIGDTLADTGAGVAALVTELLADDQHNRSGASSSSSPTT